MTGSTLFCSTALARRIEAAEATLIVAATEAAKARGAWGLALPIGGGFACAAEAGSPMNKVVGAGFGTAVAPADLDAVERTFAELGVPVQVELGSLAEPGLGDELTRRGYRLRGFENVLGQALSGPVSPATVDGVQVRRCDPDEVDVWVDAVVEGFAHPDDVGVPSHEEFPREIVAQAERDFENAGAVAYLAVCDGAVAGGGGMRITDGIAQLTGAATVPDARRRGVQGALLAARLRDAAAAGCDMAVVTTAPGSTSQKNVQRRGFHLLYTRAVLVKEFG
ncbi:GNAT family N-acetyltransferase [Mycobacterium sp. 236(2023)]|uniref:GNAT family N-acetyltransferase n=1 Tax=Mycobacterium sp. 236(2023) TaxID=3038163 RepID=UPI0024156AC9|nr:GNAT family N-acetyltransferase [Mycobacterium sp. 236(2023)]MDG4665971.1 GNAT family N-acetyltransferase [Mycobacterium sp. 236(2023)]